MPREPPKALVHRLFHAKAFPWAAALLLAGMALPGPGHAASKLKRVLERNLGGSGNYPYSRRDLKQALTDLSAGHGFEFAMIEQNAFRTEIRKAFSDSPFKACP